MLNFFTKIRQEMLLSWKIPSNIEQENLNFIQKVQKSYKILRRLLYFYFSGQKFKEQMRIDKNCKKIIWLSYSNNSLGDSLMDLSSRILFDNTYKIDVLIHPNNKQLFEYDKIFNNIFTEVNNLKESNYDLAILDIFATRTLKIKNKYFKNLPFVSMGRFFYGYDFNRVFFSFYRMHYLLNLQKSKSEIDTIAKPYIFLKNSISIVKTSDIRIAIALGGRDPNRTYNKWDEVVQNCQSIENLEFILLGSKNGEHMQNKILKLFKEKVNIKSFVNKLSLLETASKIGQSDLLLVADGGLLHIANSLNIPSISLFCKEIDPNFRLVKSVKSYHFYDKACVDNIDANEIVTSIKAFLKFQKHE